jgi:hypothetical protein
VTIADVVTILAIPLVLEPDRAGNALLGGALVAAGGSVVYVVAHRMRRSSAQRRLFERLRRRCTQPFRYSALPARPDWSTSGIARIVTTSAIVT